MSLDLFFRFASFPASDPRRGLSVPTVIVRLNLPHLAEDKISFPALALPPVCTASAGNNTSTSVFYLLFLTVLSLFHPSYYPSEFIHAPAHCPSPLCVLSGCPRTCSHFWFLVSSFIFSHHFAFQVSNS
jgi:hypothetical protein